MCTILQILSAFFACATALPPGFIPSIISQQKAEADPVLQPTAAPAISPGDIQAASINEQVKVYDLAKAAADNAQLIADPAVKDIHRRAITDTDLVNEKNKEAFWSNEEKKWQALDALKTTEAQIDGAIANNAEAYAKSALGTIPYVAQPGFIVPIVAGPIPPVVYSPYIAAVKSVSTQTVEVKAEESKEEQKDEALVKTAELPSAEGNDAVKIEAASAEKPAESSENKPIVFANPVVAPFVGVYRYDVALPAMSPIVAHPAISYATSYQQVHGVLAPTVVNHEW